MKKCNNQSGFSIVEALLIFVIVGIVGGLGYYVYDANNKATDTYNAASETISTPVIKSDKTNDSTPVTKNSATTTHGSSDDTQKLQNASNKADFNKE